MAERAGIADLFLSLSIVWLLGANAAAQCEREWLPGTPSAGISGPGGALCRWDPDGSGPLSEMLVVGGTFDAAGSVVTNNVALFDVATGEWSAFGAGLAATDAYPLGARCGVTMPNGDLVIGGRFDGGNVQRWDGVSWTDIAWPGLQSCVCALAVLPGGDLVAGTDSGGVFRWDGTSWSSMAAGFTNAVRHLQVLANGDLLAAGYVSGFSSSGVRRWDGSTWTQLGGNCNGLIYDVVELPGGDLVACGSFRSWFSPSVAALGVARWDGTSWSQVGQGLTRDPSYLAARVYGITRLANGNLLACGVIGLSGSAQMSNLAEWDGASWTPYSGGRPGSVLDVLEWAPGEVFAVGDFGAGGSQGTEYLAKSDGTAWQSLGEYVAGEVEATISLPNGDLVIAGDSIKLGATVIGSLGRWDGVAWQGFGAGPAARVTSMAVMPNGDLVVGGMFAFVDSNGVLCNRVARWDGSSWFALGLGMDDAVHDLVVHPDGRLIAVGAFGSAGGIGANRIASWNGVSWQNFGLGVGPNTTFVKLDRVVVAPGGEVVVAGSFASAGGSPAMAAAIWDGASWSSTGSSTDLMYLQPKDLAVEADGGLVMCGESLMGAMLFRWDGSTWNPLSSPASLHSLLPLPDGRLLVGGDFSMIGSVALQNLAVLDGGSWSTYAGGTDGIVRSLELGPDGAIVAAGGFRRAGGEASALFAELITTCPAQATSIATGCVGPAGPIDLTASELAWVGGSLASHATGFAPSSFGIAVLGLSTVSVPLASIDPAGLPGCDLLAATDSLTVVLPSPSGTSSFAFALPNDTSLAGLSLTHQIVQFTTPPAAGYSISSSNGMLFTIGAL